MKVCDICKKPSQYNTTVATNSEGGIAHVDLCGRCYMLLYKKENQHRFLAYQETVEEVLNQPKLEDDNTWLKRYIGFWRHCSK